MRNGYKNGRFEKTVKKTVEIPASERVEFKTKTSAQPSSLETQNG